MSSVATEPPPPPPSGKDRRRTGTFIAVFIALQFLIPLTYLGREDPSDDRFTWRSSELTPACETTVTTEAMDGHTEALDLERLVHRDWITYVQHNRRAVVEALLQKQCEGGDVLEVALFNHCDDSRGLREYRLRCGSERAYETQRTASR